jgi:hypothetical protein
MKECNAYYWNEDMKLERPKNYTNQHQSHIPSEEKIRHTCTKAETPLEGDLSRWRGCLSLSFCIAADDVAMLSVGTKLFYQRSLGSSNE